MLAFLRLALWCGLIAGLVGLGYGYSKEKASHAADNEAHAAMIRDMNAQAKAASERAKADRIAADKHYSEAQHDAEIARDALARNLRSGTVRLRPEWACSSPSDAATVAGGQDDAAGLRADSAARIIAAADSADAQVIWLQSEITSTRKACGVSE